MEVRRRCVASSQDWRAADDDDDGACCRLDRWPWSTPDDARRAEEGLAVARVRAGDQRRQFIEVADAVEEEFPELAVVGNEGASMAADVPRQVSERCERAIAGARVLMMDGWAAASASRQGAFEVHFDGRTLFSALQQKRLPETDEVSGERSRRAAHVPRR
eukprot:scaffold2960_cov273-Prasinococcus_capsulatus_cf.AAC.1